MTISEFIRAHSEEILSQWEEFARSVPAAHILSRGELRDHAAQMLNLIADDLEQPQTSKEQTDKSKGATDADSTSRNGALAHGAGRAELGFSYAQLISEFRALRASVLRQWAAAGVGDNPGTSNR